MNPSPFRSTVEQVLFDEPDWKLKYLHAAQERDAWQDRVHILERQLAAAKDAASNPESASCLIAGCFEPPANVSRTGLCLGHLRDAWSDMNSAWEEQESLYPARDIPSPVPQRRPILPSRPWVVYYIRMGDRVKIGRTSDLAQRMRSFCAQADQLLAVEPGVTVRGVDREIQRHQEFAAQRVDGTELFDMSDELRAHIAGVVETFGNPLQYT